MRNVYVVGCLGNAALQADCLRSKRTLASGLLVTRTPGPPGGLFHRRTLGHCWHKILFLHAGRPSGHPPDGVKAPRQRIRYRKTFSDTRLCLNLRFLSRSKSVANPFIAEIVALNFRPFCFRDPRSGGDQRGQDRRPNSRSEKQITSPISRKLLTTFRTKFGHGHFGVKNI